MIFDRKPPLVSDSKYLQSLVLAYLDSTYTVASLCANLSGCFFGGVYIIRCIRRVSPLLRAPHQGDGKRGKGTPRSQVMTYRAPGTLMHAGV
jgi:hypothetical protein